MNYITARKSRRNPRPSRKLKQPIQNPSLQIGSGQYVPALLRTSLRFSATSDVKTSSLDLIRISGNNVQDPLGSTGTGAPPGFTYLASMYERYRVIGSQCQAEWRICSETKDTSTVATAAKGILFPSNNTTSLATGSDYAAQPFAKVVSFTTQLPGSVTQKMSSAKILGQKDVLGPDRLQSQVTTGPADEWFWRIITAPDNDVSTSTLMIVTFQVTYDVEFFDRQPLDRSSVSVHFDRAYYEHCKLIIAAKSQREAERKASADKLDKAMLKEVLESKEVDDWTVTTKPSLSVQTTPMSRQQPSINNRSVRH